MSKKVTNYIKRSLLSAMFCFSLISATIQAKGLADSSANVAGLVSIPSSYSLDITEQKLLAILKKKGLTLFTVVDHYTGAKSVGLDIEKTKVVIFGNPKVGTPLMQCAPTVAIDLPQKILIYHSKDGVVWLNYNDPAYLQERHNIQGCDQYLKKITNVLKVIAKAAAQ